VSVQRARGGEGVGQGPKGHFRDSQTTRLQCEGRLAVSIYTDAVENSGVTSKDVSTAQDHQTRRCAGSIMESASRKK
jgi:hypothetical protein